jgi:hypothetical protein
LRATQIKLNRPSQHFKRLMFAAAAGGIENSSPLAFLFPERTPIII